MAQKLQTKLSLIEWCDQQVSEGKELAMHWEGGGDSGWVYFTIDGDQITAENENSHIVTLLDKMYDELDYGSWAGEFSANGEAIYDPEQKAFVGTDYYGEDQTESHKCEIKIRVPKDYWFNSIEFNIEGEDPQVDFAFILRNGFLSDEHLSLAEYIRTELQEAIAAEISKFVSDPINLDFQSIWQNDRIERSQFIEEGDMLVCTITELNMTVRSTDEKDIYLELTPEDIIEDEEE